MKQINIQSLLKHILTPMGIFSISIFLIALGIILMVTVRDEARVELTQDAFNKLESPNRIPKEELTKLRTLQSKQYLTPDEFMKDLAKAEIDTTNTSLIDNIMGAVEFGANENNETVGYLSEGSFIELQGLSKETLNKLKPLQNKWFSEDQLRKDLKNIFGENQAIIDRVFSVVDFNYEYNLTGASFDSLRAWGVPDAILKKAEPLKGKKLIEEEFMKQLKERIGEVDFNTYYQDFYDLYEVKYVVGLTDDSFSRLKGSAVPEAILAGLRPLVGQKYYEADFSKELNNNVKNEELINEYNEVILRNLVYEYGGGEIQTLTGGALLFLGALSLLIALILGASSLAVKKRLKVEHYQGLVEESKKVSEKVRPTWDMAKATLEQYFDRNLKQINLIFYVSVFVMLVGFGIIIFAIYISIKPSGGSDSVVTPAVIGTLSGIITEFIGATFLFIYKSTVEQAIRYTSSLERINSVGMSMQILDTIQQTKETLTELTQAKISISKLLLMQTREAQLEDGEPGNKTHPKKA